VLKICAQIVLFTHFWGRVHFSCKIFTYFFCFHTDCRLSNLGPIIMASRRRYYIKTVKQCVAKLSDWNFELGGYRVCSVDMQCCADIIHGWTRKWNLDMFPFHDWTRKRNLDMFPLGRPIIFICYSHIIKSISTYSFQNHILMLFQNLRCAISEK
jgi:hypothetical protein